MKEKIINKAKNLWNDFKGLGEKCTNVFLRKEKSNIVPNCDILTAGELNWQTQGNVGPVKN